MLRDEPLQFRHHGLGPIPIGVAGFQPAQPGEKGHQVAAVLPELFLAFPGGFGLGLPVGIGAAPALLCLGGKCLLLLLIEY